MENNEKVIGVELNESNENIERVKESDENLIIREYEDIFGY